MVSLVRLMYSCMVLCWFKSDSSSNLLFFLGLTVYTVFMDEMGFCSDWATLLTSLKGYCSNSVGTEPSSSVACNVWCHIIPIAPLVAIHDLELGLNEGVSLYTEEPIRFLLSSETAGFYCFSLPHCLAAPHFHWHSMTWSWTSSTV